MKKKNRTPPRRYDLATEIIKLHTNFYNGDRFEQELNTKFHLQAHHVKYVWTIIIS